MTAMEVNTQIWRDIAEIADNVSLMKQLAKYLKKLTAKKNEQYESYSFARAKYRELQTIQANVQSFLRDTPEAMREHDQELS